MKLNENAKYDLAALTSMGVRLTPLDRRPVAVSNRFELQATSAETNVLNVSAALSLNTLALTKFVKGSEISAFIKSELRRRNISYTGPEVEQGGPWGYRHQFNIADSGFGARGPRVQNDRAGEVGRTISPADFDFESIFGQEGCRILHLSGLIAALSPESSRCCLEAARSAAKHGCRVSFDLNYRASFWEGRESELRSVFTEIASAADILIGNEEDFQLALGIAGPKAGGEGLTAKTDSFKEMIGRVRDSFPNATVFANTFREVLSANAHNWGAMLLAGDEWRIEPLREIPVYDRIGGGDGFVGGLLYAILKGYEPKDWLRLGWASGALAVTTGDDYATPIDEEQLRSIYSGNARVKR